MKTQSAYKIIFDHVNRTQGNLEMANYIQPWNISAITYKNSLHVLSCGQFFLNVFEAPPPPTTNLFWHSFWISQAWVLRYTRYDER